MFASSFFDARYIIKSQSLQILEHSTKTNNEWSVVDSKIWRTLKISEIRQWWQRLQCSGFFQFRFCRLISIMEGFFYRQATVQRFRLNDDFSRYASTESVNWGVIYNVFYAHGLKADKTNVTQNNINAQMSVNVERHPLIKLQLLICFWKRTAYFQTF